jgi:hypothetical protein
MKYLKYNLFSYFRNPGFIGSAGIPGRDCNVPVAGLVSEEIN